MLPYLDLCYVPVLYNVTIFRHVLPVLYVTIFRHVLPVLYVTIFRVCYLYVTCTLPYLDVCCSLLRE